MIIIRLHRVGKKNQASFRLVLTEKSAPAKGKVIEILGNYNPRLKTKALKAERIKYWLSKGAQTSATVHNLLVSEKVIEAAKVKAWKPKKKEGGKAVPAQKPSQEPQAAPITEQVTEQSAKNEKAVEKEKVEAPTTEAKENSAEK